MVESRNISAVHGSKPSLQKISKPLSVVIVMVYDHQKIIVYLNISPGVKKWFLYSSELYKDYTSILMCSSEATGTYTALDFSSGIIVQTQLLHLVDRTMEV